METDCLTWSKEQRRRLDADDERRLRDMCAEMYEDPQKRATMPEWGVYLAENFDAFAATARAGGRTIWDAAEALEANWGRPGHPGSAQRKGQLNDSL